MCGVRNLGKFGVHAPLLAGGLREQPFCSLPLYIYRYLYIYKEGLSRTVVRELLPRARTHRLQTFPDYGRHTRSRSKGGDVREEAPAEERAAKNLQTNVRHLKFTEKIYGFPRTLLCCQYKRRTPTVVREHEAIRIPKSENFRFRYSYGFKFVCIYNYTSGQTCPLGGSLRVLGVCQLVGHRLVIPSLLRPQLVMHWLVMHVLAKDSPGWPGDVSMTKSLKQTEVTL